MKLSYFCILIILELFCFSFGKVVHIISDGDASLLKILKAKEIQKQVNKGKEKKNLKGVEATIGDHSWKPIEIDPPLQEVTENPTGHPTVSPTLNPSATPTSSPTFQPTEIPTQMPTFSPIIVPPEWMCEVEYYGQRDGCDCFCGVSDPDCLDLDQPTYCLLESGLEPANERCATECESEGYSSYSSEVANPDAPEDFLVHCFSAWWDSADGCDCNCGGSSSLDDPDCNIPDAEVFCHSGVRSTSPVCQEYCA